MYIASRILSATGGLTGYRIVIGVGAVVGFISVMLMFKVPGGEPIPSQKTGSGHWADMTATLRDKNFTAYLVGMAGVIVGTAMLTLFLPLYLVNHIGIPPATVVRLDMVTMGGGAVATLLVGWLSDRVGSRPVLMPMLTLLAVVPLGWLLLPSAIPNPIPWCIALYAAWGIAFNSATLTSLRLLFNKVIPPERSTSYTSIYYAWAGVSGGIAPLLAGRLLKVTAEMHRTLWHWTFTGHDLLFALAVIFLALGAFLYARVSPDDRHTTRTALRSGLNRIFPHKDAEGT